MLKETINQYLQDQIKNNSKVIKLFRDEKEYAEQYRLLPDGVTVEEIEPLSRFDEAYIERGNKLTDDVIAKETNAFLKLPIDYFKKHINEFMFVESKWLEFVRVDAISFEIDDVFGTYDVMLGLRFPKKLGTTIKDQLRNQLQSNGATFDLMFNNEDGLWDLNFSLEHVDGFKEELTIGQAYVIIYSFLFTLVKNIEENW
ncbi:branched-chain amino acid aminotransferase [Bacillus sp. Marseille-P3661]|uniref:branched-chain amino acid aminotransferase n=1 Tax=Bacillus sp. Marseille-P3661 TaxID=1936234 RepID=UPI002155267F|nr:branched-chain amino acid aminotransferase [Bacillus sp. Marseille-P3661]